ncbi:DoxX family protein [Agrobacterium rosae]
MPDVAVSMPLPRWQRLTGSVMSGLVVAFLIFDGTIKLAPIAPVTETMVALGYSGDPSLARGLGIMTLAIALLYAIPRTSVLGAILMTGLLGGAIATHLRVGSPLFTHMFFGVYLGLLAWGGLYLRSEALRRLIPLRGNH